MTKKEAHWMEDDSTRKRFWAYAKGDLGLTEDEVHEALSVESTKDFDGDKDMARAMLKAYAVDVDARRLVKSLKPQPPTSDNPRTVAFCDVFAPDGTRIAVTAREGATADTVALTALALWDGAQILTRLGWTLAAENGNGAVETLAQKPENVPAGSPPPPPPTTPASAPGVQKPSNGGGEQVETFLVQAIKSQVTPNGNSYYAVKGGRCTKRGVTAWPEVAEPQIQAIAKFDLTTLEIGQEWKPPFQIQAVSIVPEGREWPNKVTAFAPAP